MTFSTTIPIALLLLTQLVLPGYFIYSVWRGGDDSRLAWCLKAAYSGAYIVYVFFVGRWDWMSYYGRFVPLTLFVVAAIIGATRTRGQRWLVTGPRQVLLGMAIPVLVLALFVSLLVRTARGYVYDDDAVRLVLPLKDGTYYVAQGGNCDLLNYHNSHREQRYALDVVALNTIGSRAWGLYPAELNRYVIFGATVYSPCDGTLLDAVDGLPDHVPPTTDRERAAGNHVVIGCHGVRVVLAHLQNGSVAGQPGMPVLTGQAIGRVGNSGNTSEPHLHVHAMRDTASAEEGEGVPILFDGTFPVRNTILTSDAAR